MYILMGFNLYYRYDVIKEISKPTYSQFIGLDKLVIELIKLFFENTKIIFWPKKLFFCQLHELSLLKMTFMN